MRENLFRGKRRDNGEWVYGSLFVGFKKSYICPEAIAMYNFDGALCLGGFAEVYPETVGQYTGLHDATKWENLPEKEQQEFLRIHKKEDWNGKQIFEGDILKWDSREWGCDHLDIANWDYELFNMRRTDWEEWCEVIGNIHDNPDLLLESKEEK